MYLLDTNILLELLLDQERADEVEDLLAGPDGQHLCVSDFSLFSIGIHLFRRGLPQVFLAMLEDLFPRGAIHVTRLEMTEMAAVLDAAQAFSLDFDDAYQYALAEHRDLGLISFDRDFDSTARGRRTPVQVMARDAASRKDEGQHEEDSL